MTKLKAYMSASLVGVEYLRPYLEGNNNSGAMKVSVPPCNALLDAIESCGSNAMVVNQKSARHAVGGVSFVMRIFACHGMRNDMHTSST